MKQAATYTGIALAFAALAFCLFGMAGCGAIMDGLQKVVAPLTENGFRAVISLGVGLLLWVFIPAGEVGKVLVALFGTYVTQAATTDSSDSGPPHVPTFLESLMSFLGTSVGLIVLVSAVVLIYRSEWFIKAIKGGPDVSRLGSLLHAVWPGSKTRALTVKKRKS